MSESDLSKLKGPGFFYVQSQPKPELPADEFDQWYNTEHGPARLNLDLFPNGYRYKSRGLEPPVWLACYDLKKISGLTEPQYTILREKRSSREIRVLTRMKYMDRRIYSMFSSKGVDKSPAATLLAVTMYVKDELVGEVDRWYEEEHIDDLSRIPGWIRSRRFRLVSGGGVQEGITELLALHEFEKENGFDGPEHQLAKARPWRMRIVNEVIEGKDNKTFDFYHAFKAQDYRQPEDVNNVSTPFKSGSTSFGHWQLDGSEDPNAPLVVFSNSLLTDLHIWDATVAQLMARLPKLRFLRYNTRGYESHTGNPTTVDELTDDLYDLLVNVVGVHKCLAVIGVSLGGVTSLAFAARYPDRLDRFIACDCNLASSAKNTEAWSERIKLSRSHSGWAKLAGQTVERWFTSASVQLQTDSLLAVQKMVLSASTQGFVESVHALCDFDLSEKVKDIQVPGLCVVGEADGSLPNTVASFSKDIPNTRFTEIRGAGHLPMVEQPHAFVDAIVGFLEPK